MMPPPLALHQQPHNTSIDVHSHEDLRRLLVDHRLYGLIDSATAMRRFMEHHVYCVWDFQSLLTSLQQRFTCTSIPWIPTPDAHARRLVNEIVLDEESDALPDGSHASHFELYLESMTLAGADVGSIHRLLELLRAGKPLAMSLETCGAPSAAVSFVKNTFELIDSGDSTTILAAFTFGREDVIPDMFRNIVVSLADQDPLSWNRFRYYLDRHITHDDARHAPICRALLQTLCGSDPDKQAAASRTARQCLEARIVLWDAIAADLGS
ncbi:MAG: DUF3050 domain-containing protein [Planctomycetota bacterium]|nr:DUF3050 domain-containing protein [Planctomycetia bacterium]MDO7677379.1 DUF3050 domain-containing protein [Pirellulales bacterium]TSA02786.1 MAG: DUF3050 domain-containing protein [Planctomycetaceae bacterium]